MVFQHLEEHRNEQMDHLFVFESFISSTNEKEKMDKGRLNSLDCCDDRWCSSIWSCVYFIIDQCSQVGKMVVDANRSHAPCTGSSKVRALSAVCVLSRRKNWPVGRASEFVRLTAGGNRIRTIGPAEGAGHRRGVGSRSRQLFRWQEIQQRRDEPLWKP